MVHPDEGAVDAELLGGDRELDGLEMRVARGAGERPVRLLPMAEGEEADALPVRDVRLQLGHRRIKAADSLLARQAACLRHGRRTTG